MSEAKTLKSESRGYLPEFRIQSARLIVEQGVGLSQAARDLDVPLATLHAWVKRFKNGEWSLPHSNLKAVKVETVKKKENGAKTPSTSQKLHDQLISEQRKNSELERQLRRMTMERDILKKAMAYCLDVPK